MPDVTVKRTATIVLNDDEISAMLSLMDRARGASPRGVNEMSPEEIALGQEITAYLEEE